MDNSHKNNADFQQQVTLSHNQIPGRYIIVDANDGHLIDDAQGYGFWTEDNAVAYANVQGWIVLNREVVECDPLF